MVKVKNGTGLLRVFWFFLASIIPLVLHAHSFTYHRRYINLEVDKFVKLYTFSKSVLYSFLLYVVVLFYYLPRGIKKITKILHVDYCSIQRNVWLRSLAFRRLISAWYLAVLVAATKVLHSVTSVRKQCDFLRTNQDLVALRTWISLCAVTYKGLQRKTIALMSSMYFIWPLRRMLRVPWLPRRWSRRRGSVGLCLLSITAVLLSSSAFGVRITSSSNNTECRYNVCNTVIKIFHCFQRKVRRILIYARNFHT
jgi:hypothetical protein